MAAAQARIARILAESRYRVLQGLDPNSIEDSIDSSRTGAPTVLTQLRSQVATARATLAQLLATLGPNHPQVQSQTAQVAELDRELHTEESRLLTQAKEDFVIARSNQDQTLAALEEQKAQAYKDARCHGRIHPTPA